MRKTVLIFVGCAAALLAGYAGYQSYTTWKQGHFMRLAREFLAKPDVRNAALALDKVLQFNPRHLEAMRLMASLSEAGRSPSALLWRARVVQLNPHSVPDRLALAQTALMFRDIACRRIALPGSGPARAGESRSAIKPGRRPSSRHPCAGHCRGAPQPSSHLKKSDQFQLAL